MLALLAEVGDGAMLSLSWQVISSFRLFLTLAWWGFLLRCDRILIFFSSPLRSFKLFIVIDSLYRSTAPHPCMHPLSRLRNADADTEKLARSFTLVPLANPQRKCQVCSAIICPTQLPVSALSFEFQ